MTNPEYAVNTPTQAEYSAVIGWAIKNGKEVSIKPTTSKIHGKETCIRIADGNLEGFGSTGFYQGEGKTVIPFSTWALITGAMTYPEPKTIQIGEYSSTVDYATQTVVVGCQTIPFSKVAEVYELTRKHAK